MKTFLGSLVLLAAALRAEASDDVHVRAQKAFAMQAVQSSGPGTKSAAVSDAASEVKPVYRMKVGSTLQVGAEVCITGNIMDNWCIYSTGGDTPFPDKPNLDQPNVVTLKNPEKHTVFCLLEVGTCEKSGFQVLGPKNPDTGFHCPGFRLDDTAAVLAGARAVGKKVTEGGKTCKSCTNEAEDAPTVGLQLTIKGKIADMGDGSEDTAEGVAMLTDLQVLPPTEKCDGPDTVPPHSMCMSADAPAAPAEPEPTPPAPTPPAPTPPAPTPPGDSEPAEPSGAWQASAAPAWLGALVASALVAV